MDLQKILKQVLSHIGIKGRKLSETIWDTSKKNVETELSKLINRETFKTLSLEDLDERVVILNDIKVKRSYTSKETGHKLDGRNGILKNQ